MDENPESSDERVVELYPDDREPSPSRVTPVVLSPKLDLLPTHEMAWENFEVLLRKMAIEVLGLKNVRIYGVRGQTQHGIDIVGVAPNESPVAIQTKKYQEFTKDDLVAAVAKYTSGMLPFAVTELIVAAGCNADRTEVTDKLYELNDKHDQFEIEFWDRRTISDMLRNRQDIVTEFFGDGAAAVFCLPARPHVVAAPPPDKAVVADALMRGPAQTTGAAGHIARAAIRESTDPRGAAVDVEAAEKLLAESGFGGHATVLARRRADLLRRAGIATEAAVLLSARFWHAVESNELTEAQLLARQLAEVTSSAPAPSSMEPDGAGVELEDTQDHALLSEVAGEALRVVSDPLRPVDIDLDRFSDSWLVNEAAQLAAIRAETCAVDAHDTWTHDNAQQLRALADRVEESGPEAPGVQMLAYRLRIEVADATSDWQALLDLARRRRVSRRIAAMIFARHAMHLAERGDFDDADASWVAAIEQACLDGRNDDAAEWVYSRRMLMSRHAPFTEDLDDFHRLARSLQELGGPSTQLVARRALERALLALAENRSRAAVIALRAYLRRGHAAGGWRQVNQARELLAGVYQGADELDRAAPLIILAGDTKMAKELAKAAGDRYLDVRFYLTNTAYWVNATAFRFIAEQADIVADNHVDEIALAALAILNKNRAGDLQDTPFFGPSVYEAAHAALAGLAERLTQPHAATLLEHLQPLVPRQPNHYRHTDDSHIRACVGIATARPDLRINAITQLLDLLAAESGVAQKVEQQADDLFLAHVDLVRDRLTSLAEQGNSHAARLLALMTSEPADEQMAAAFAAAAALRAPTGNGPGHYGIGTGAVHHSILASKLPAAERLDLVRTQLEKARSPHEPASNRSDYFIAAANLSNDLENVDHLFENAMELAHEAAPSHADLVMNVGNHPLGAFRSSGFGLDTRPSALFLAAALARTPEQKARARDTAITLLASGEHAGWYVARALQFLDPADLERDVHLLAVHPSWAIRSLAAITWVGSAAHDIEVGLLLAKDVDPRVRRTLAHQLVHRVKDSEAIEIVKAELGEDSRFSVRRVLDLPNDESAD